MEDPVRISVLLNGERRRVAAGTAMTALVEGLGLPIQAVLIEHNGRALLHSELPEVRLAEGDRIEILRVVAGG